MLDMVVDRREMKSLLSRVRFMGAAPAPPQPPVAVAAAADAEQG